MLTDERTLKPGLFPLPDVRVARNILIPGFRAATTIRGAFGWFTAGWIQQLAPGLAVYLTRDDTEPMEFTVAPALFPAERRAVERGAQMTEEEAAQLVADVFVEGRVDAGPLARHALDCLSWMIAADSLQLRIAVPTPESNYHPKLWLFDDGENQVLARGSGNATGKGVAAGVEHLDVDVSWQSDSRVPAGITMLDNWSTGQSPGIARVFDLPEAVARDIIQTALNNLHGRANTMLSPSGTGWCSGERRLARRTGSEYQTSWSGAPVATRIRAMRSRPGSRATLKRKG